MLRTLTYRILSATDGQTILHYLKSLGYSGPILVHLKKTDHGTLLNGVWAHMNETLHTGDLLCLHLEENTSGTSIFPQQIPLAICYEDEDLLVIDKPAGMPVHPSAAHQRDTLANAVTGYYRAKRRNPPVPLHQPAGCRHERPDHRRQKYALRRPARQSHAAAYDPPGIPRRRMRHAHRKRHRPRADCPRKAGRCPPAG